MIDVNKIDRRRLSILCKSPKNIEKLNSFFTEKGFRVDIETSVTNFFSHLQDIRPGFVLVSKSIDSSMARELPEFLHKKFKIPVILFQETPDDQNNPENDSKKKSQKKYSKNNISGVVHVSSNSGADIHKQLQSFETQFDKISEDLENKDDFLSSKKEFELGNQVMNQISDKVVESEISIEENQKVQIFSFCIQDPEGEGNFFFALPIKSDQVDPSVSVNKLTEEITASLGLETKVDNVSNKVSYELFQELQKNSDRAITGYLGDQEISISYFEGTPDKIEEEISVKGSSFLVPVEEWWTHLALNFKAYLWLEKNRKRILYLKKGFPLSEKTYKKFEDHGIDKMMIHPDDLPLYKIQKRMSYFATQSDSNDLD